VIQRLLLGEPYPKTAEALGGASSPTRTVTTQYRILSARFLDATAFYGQKVTARVSVSPASNTTGTLQRWTWHRLGRGQEHPAGQRRRQLHVHRRQARDDRLPVLGRRQHRT